MIVDSSIPVNQLLFRSAALYEFIICRFLHTKKHLKVRIGKETRCKTKLQVLTRCWLRWCGSEVIMHIPPKRRSTPEPSVHWNTKFPMNWAHHGNENVLMLSSDPFWVSFWNPIQSAVSSTMNLLGITVVLDSRCTVQSEISDGTS